LSNFFVLTFFISIISLIVFLIKPKFRNKKYILGAILGIFFSFVLIGITASSETKVATEKKAKEEQVAKEKAEAEKKAREEQVAKEKAEAEKKAKEEQVAKEKAEAEKKAKEEQVAKEKAEAEQKAREEQIAREAAEAEQRAREEQIAREAAEAEQRAREEQTAALQVQQDNQNDETIGGITGYCKDGTVATGDPSARGKANSCYGHGGWVR